MPAVFEEARELGIWIHPACDIGDVHMDPLLAILGDV